MTFELFCMDVEHALSLRSVRKELVKIFRCGITTLCQTQCNKHLLHEEKWYRDTLPDFTKTFGLILEIT